MRKLTYLCAAVFAATLLLAAAPAPSVQSAETIVTSTENEGPGTLREAVLSAAPGNTITFDTDIFAPDDPATIHLNGPITLGQGGLTVDGSNAGVILDGMDGPESGLIIESSDNIVYGIKFINFSFSGIAIIGGDTPGKAENNHIGGDHEKGDGPYGQGNCFGLSTTGVVIERGAANNTVSGNLVGIDADGSDLGNANGGILVQAGSNNNTIGPDNVIANNNAYGIQAEGSDPLTITQNAIYNQEIPVELVNGSNSEIQAGVEINTLVAAIGQVGGDTCPTPSPPWKFSAATRPVRASSKAVWRSTRTISRKVRTVRRFSWKRAAPSKAPTCTSPAPATTAAPPHSAKAYPWKQAWMRC